MSGSSLEPTSDPFGNLALTIMSILECGYFACWTKNFVLQQKAAEQGLRFGLDIPSFVGMLVFWV